MTGVRCGESPHASRNTLTRLQERQAGYQYRPPTRITNAKDADTEDLKSIICQPAQAGSSLSESGWYSHIPPGRMRAKWQRKCNARPLPDADERDAIILWPNMGKVEVGGAHNAGIFEPGPTQP